MVAGIYKITNTVNGKCYYGSSKNIKLRWGIHKSTLRGNYHPNIILQRAWNKYGEASFVFEVAVECDVDSLLDVEDEYINKNNGGYNIAGAQGGRSSHLRKPIAVVYKDGSITIVGSYSECERRFGMYRNSVCRIVNTGRLVQKFKPFKVYTLDKIDRTPFESHRDMKWKKRMSKMYVLMDNGIPIAYGKSTRSVANKTKISYSTVWLLGKGKPSKKYPTLTVSAPDK